MTKPLREYLPRQQMVNQAVRWVALDKNMAGHCVPVRRSEWNCIGTQADENTGHHWRDYAHHSASGGTKLQNVVPPVLPPTARSVFQMCFLSQGDEQPATYQKKT